VGILSAPRERRTLVGASERIPRSAVELDHPGARLDVRHLVIEDDQSLEQRLADQASGSTVGLEGSVARAILRLRAISSSETWSIC
jgi:hypothetical protein